MSGYRFVAVPVKPDATPHCAGCGEPFLGSWRLEQAVGLNNPYICGQPKKDGSPCGWNTTQEVCPYHPTPDALQREHERKQAEQERRRQAEEERQQESELRRLDLIQILSVRCPHCSASAAALCCGPKGGVVRTLHKARRQLAGVSGPKSFVIEATNQYTRTVDEPPLDADLRSLLSDPLKDRTKEASARYYLEEQGAAERKVAAAQRALWLAGGDRADLVRAQPCPTCHAGPPTACDQRGWRHGQFHTERIDAAMTMATRTVPEGSP
ncbi:zinc finger domain-containing protein [Streptomyces durhamensis]|uniref:zinc finger domain-containing protein n=1 Tax=Streptomyces durhamensis TaxID=68194 RepID=UPI001FD74E81|nr:hypothetical protein [Streptomyces durhamensis]